MAEIGTFTPEQARLVWQDYLSRQQLQPRIRENFPQRRPIDEPSPHRVFIKNTSAETMPAFGCGQITGTATEGGVTVVTVSKPTTTDGEYLINAQFSIAAGGVGWAYRFGVVIFTGTAASGVAEFRPIVSSWNIEEGAGPFVIFGAHSVVANGLIGRFKGGGGGGDGIAFYGFEITSVTGGAMTGEVYASPTFNTASPTATGVSLVDPMDVFGALPVGTVGYCVPNGDSYLIVVPSCPPEIIVIEESPP